MRDKLKILAKILIPVLIGVGVVVWLFGREFDISSLRSITLGDTTVPGIILAFLALAIRQMAMAWRFRALTDRRLRWLPATKVTFLCDFTSAITPTSVGGSVLSMIFLSREGIHPGRATAITMTTLFLDELYMVVMCPLLFLFMSANQLFGFSSDAAATDLEITFWIVYAILCGVTVVLFVGLFFSPHLIANALKKLFSLPILRRWRKNIDELGDNLIATSRELHHKDIKWWGEALLSTFVLWTFRFLIVNALFFAFYPEADQLTIFGRQFVVWALLIFTPTPGGSGVSEMLFKTYYADIVGGPLLMVLAISWRILTYYIYLLAGIGLIPTFLKSEKQKNDRSHNIS